MARRADWDVVDDDDFEVLTDALTANKEHLLVFGVGDEPFEMVFNPDRPADTQPAPAVVQDEQAREKAFDYKSVLRPAPFGELLADAAREREQLLHLAKERQQALISAMRLN